MAFAGGQAGSLGLNQRFEDAGRQGAVEGAAVKQRL